MIVYDLCCSRGHRFEGWFGSAAEFDSQQQAGMVDCPVCADTCVTRRPSVSRLNLGAVAPEGAEPQATTGTASGTVPQALLDEVRRYIDERVENVGDRFAEEARRIHYGESASRPIRGVASGAEVRDLNDEGIETMVMPSTRSDKAKLN